jgi:hypothetical protein
MQRADQLHQGVDIATDDAVGGLHPLDGGQRQAGQRGQRPLVDPQQSTGGAHLSSGYHVSDMKYRVLRWISQLSEMDLSPM